MEDPDRESRKVPLTLVAAALILLVMGLAYWGHQAAVAHTVEMLYGRLLSKAPEAPEQYATEVERLERAERLLAIWSSLDGPTIDFETVGADLPLPLRLTRTLHADNPENLRKRAAEIYGRDLAALSGRKAFAATSRAWKAELESWRAALGRSIKVY
jgi:hypothetical protein